ncbi:hypothetical protein LOTGIDRAFT_166220 [Lottia gigantea]|uniref:Uncharacterized protein n=1 Tax=Lottia gigantea TaxID=225164 RepID=V3ZZ60_LOTGI|nr:hypothetical protein LOTGIDRAFT_166220 [Lottia gigantea]ESO87920.1 hypothetical protein LOTGIDRAFT_166220 [Lottia gigantea]
MGLKAVFCAADAECAKMERTTFTVPGLFFWHCSPGIWEAVEGDDAMNVRKLVNQWSRVDVQQKNGKSLLQLALEVGNESIIRVVSCIRPSMSLLTQQMQIIANSR